MRFSVSWLRLNGTSGSYPGYQLPKTLRTSEQMTIVITWVARVVEVLWMTDVRLIDSFYSISSGNPLCSADSSCFTGYYMG